MAYYLVKLVISALTIVVISELAKRNPGIGALVASLPLTSILAFVWMRQDAVPNAQIASMSMQIFWLVIPSLALFIVFYLLLSHGFRFWFSLLVSCGATAALYLGLLPLARKLGIEL